MSSEVTGLVITLFGASALALAFFGSRFHTKNHTAVKPAILPKENSIVPVRTTPAEPIPQTNATPDTFVRVQPQISGRATLPSRRAGAYVRRTAPKRSTLTKDQTQNAPG